MDNALRIAILELLDAADYAAEALDNFTDYVDGEYGTSEPNKALVAKSYLTDTMEKVHSMMESR